ncbi:hypothetical protein [Arthrobacter sp. NtRootA1]|uniref:hypothetical protein n=1 Tax=Arthrobacter sp. NtRootA1 TaxID=2830983 RepID=UPI001CC517DB|nr:hypothetical protein [Arthrobacter sp. NtRootA1]BCW05725.1 hypothetical protein NtRootA1_18630 [Arthrobacter sp. NtRootA1]
MSPDLVFADFRCTSAMEAEQEITAAVAAAELHAYSSQAGGVLVTRHDFNRFSVQISPLVPFGCTVEHDAVVASSM